LPRTGGAEKESPDDVSSIEQTYPFKRPDKDEQFFTDKATFDLWDEFAESMDIKITDGRFTSSTVRMVRSMMSSLFSSTKSPRRTPISSG
jgi:hypothetical protein